MDKMILLAIAELLEAIAAALRVWAKYTKNWRIVVNRVIGLLKEAQTTDAMTFDGEWLTWGGERYTSVSGPHGKGALPNGEYLIDWRHCSESPELGAPFTAGGVSFWVPVTPQFDAEGRSGFGIHPDGGQVGSLGCIAISAEYCASFWSRVRGTPMELRPTRLLVEIG